MKPAVVDKLKPNPPWRIENLQTFFSKVKSLQKPHNMRPYFTVKDDVLTLASFSHFPPNVITVQILFYQTTGGVSLSPCWYRTCFTVDNDSDKLQSASSQGVLRLTRTFLTKAKFISRTQNLPPS